MDKESKNLTSIKLQQFNSKVAFLHLSDYTFEFPQKSRNRKIDTLSPL